MTGTRHRITVLTCATVTCAAVLLAAGCAGTAGTADGPVSSPAAPLSEPLSEPANDPALLSAADTIYDLARTSFAGCYAGMVLDHPRHTMTVYRKPGCDLEAAVGEQVPLSSGITLIFRDATMSLDEMLALTRRITADAGYWKSRGITITGAGPQNDGSGISVTTEVGGSVESADLSDHYGRPVVATRGSAVAPPAAPYRPSTGPQAPPRR